MNKNIKIKTALVDKLENDFNLKSEGTVDSNKIMKDRALSILSGLKRDQDNPANEEDDEVYEDLIFRVIKIVGHL